MKLWDVSSPWPAARTMSHGGFLYAVAFSPDSRLLASVAQSAKLKLWDVATERVMAERDNAQVRGTARLTFSPDGTLLTADDSGTVRLFEVPSLVEVTNFRGRRPFFSPAGTEVIYIRSGSVHRRNLKTHAEQAWKTGWSGIETAALWRMPMIDGIGSSWWARRRSESHEFRLRQRRRLGHLRLLRRSVIPR